MSFNFILEGHKVVRCDNIIKWANWFEKADRHVAKTTLRNGVEISTVFLGVDHNFLGRPPILFETMIFGGELDDEMEQYSTWQDAEKGHKKWVAKAQSKQSVTPSRKDESRPK